MYEGGNIAQWKAYMLLGSAAPGLNLGSGVFFVIKLSINYALLRVRVDYAKTLIVDRARQYWLLAS